MEVNPHFNDLLQAALRRMDREKQNLIRGAWTEVADELPEPGERVIAGDDTFVGEAYLGSDRLWYRHYGLLFPGKVSYWTPMLTTPKAQDVKP